MRIVVGVSGGIAAYKVVGVIRTLVLAGHDVQVIPTEEALRFVGAPTFEAISRNDIATDLFDGVAQVRHVALGQAADAILVAPATANTLAKIASGMADDLLTTSILASRAPVVVAPAMHTEMWQNAATQANIQTLRQRGVQIVEPTSGQLTGSDVGVGRLAEPDDIVAAVEQAASGAPGHDLVGRRVVVTAGGTREPIDPVRFIGNRSSGRQGIAIAEAARDRGADVTLIGANLEVAPPAGVSVVEVSRVDELQNALDQHAPSADVVVMAAAVSDYRPASVAESKIKKDAVGDDLTISLTRNPDLLAGLGRMPSPRPTLVGFAAETEPDRDRLRDLAARKLERKGADLIAVNRVDEGRGFATSDNEVMVVGSDARVLAEVAGSKRRVGDGILDAVVGLVDGTDA